MGNNSGVSIVGLGTCENDQWYRKFTTECLSGQLTFCEFKQLFGLKNLSEASKAYVMRMFEMFDMYDVRLLLSRSLMFIVYTVPIERLHHPWISSHFIVTSIHVINEVNYEMSSEDLTNMMFDKIDINGDGKLGLEEFMEGIQNDEKLLETLTASLDLIHHQQDPGRDEPLLLQHKKIL
ncbi:guanylyl cyclase-activating protein 1-like [Oncorhynchus tshawytscha]|uniref:guanylyl cyclase-activating protein 1-like n=1 Tax=Oncorhynchus tshawytscha TaxID=74940 RepID=UPI000D09BF76|nr:guanylyl cyclase-activating protein 1-like [Oncorhynchus tshawytscha]